MYGYDIPRYVREKEQELKAYDRHLRIRRSLDTPGAYVVERKTRYVSDHPFVRGTDWQVQLKDEYRQILVFYPCDILRVMPQLKEHDIQRMGAKQLANDLDRSDDARRDREESSRISAFEDVSSDAYDFLAWREGRKIAT